MRLRLPALAACLAALASSALAVTRPVTEKPGPQPSSLFDLATLPDDLGPGVGTVGAASCLTTLATQPDFYLDNLLLDCDGEVPHNETTIAVDPTDPDHVVGGFHDFQVHFLGATAIVRVISTVSASFDGGLSWRQVSPPVAPYQFSGDPALAFDADGRLYFANIADHEGPGGPFTTPSVIVATSDDGGLTWSSPVTVAAGQGAIAGRVPNIVFQDKEYVAADAFAASPFRNRVYVSWTSFQERRVPPVSRSPILLSWSDDGRTWSRPVEVSGASPVCAFGSQANRCDQNQFSSPAVAPTGRLYVSFANFNTPDINQLLVVRSDDGGRTFSAPLKAADVFDFGFFPTNASGRFVLTGCAFRLAPYANAAADPSDPTGNTVYVVWADNRNGTQEATNADVFLARSTDGGVTWTTVPVDTSANDQFYPWVAVAPDGRVDVGYMDRFPSAGQGVCQYGFSLARLDFEPGGTFTRTIARVDSGLSDAGRSRWFATSADPRATFIGDYNGVAVGADGATWSLWTDMRNVIPNLPASRSHGQHAVGARTPAP
jgi:hypothetical protein